MIAEARRLGVRILPIDVNRSTNEYLVEKMTKGHGVRMALTEIAGISNREIERIICEQPFRDIADFYIRARPARRTLERLALIGGTGLFGRHIGRRGSAQPRRPACTHQAANCEASCSK